MNNFFKACEAGLTNGWATLEIIIMLLVAGVIGWFLRHFIGQRDALSTDDFTTPLSNDDEDLKVIEGIGPKIEEILKKAGVDTWDDLANTEVERLQEILTNEGSRFQMHEPKTWPEQAEMARDGHWAALKDYQEFLQGGK